MSSTLNGDAGPGSGRSSAHEAGRQAAGASPLLLLRDPVLPRTGGVLGRQPLRRAVGTALSDVESPGRLVRPGLPTLR